MSRSSVGRGGVIEPLGPKIPGHELVRLIGGGSYGEVWLARNAIGTYRAVKVVHRSTFQEERPFLREFEGIRRFEPISREHPGLVDILQVQSDEGSGCFWYVMELADDAKAEGGFRNTEEISRSEIGDLRSKEGGALRQAQLCHRIDPEAYTPKTLRALLHGPEPDKAQGPPVRRSLPVKQCLEIGRDLCSALAYLHRHDLVHRDIKPSNIIFVNGVPKLADIGLVTAADQECSFVGTEGFVAPEGPGAAQADLYALGKVLYEMLTGLRARDYPKVPDAWTKGSNHEVVRELNEVVLRACQGDSKRRYASAREMGTDLDLLISGKSLAIRTLQRAVHRMRWTIAGIAAVSVMAVSLAGFWFFKNQAAAESRRRVLREVELSRTKLRPNGWFTNAWGRLEKLASIRGDQELAGQATALLAGMDAHAIAVFQGLESTSGAFAPDGRLLISGAGEQPAVLIETNGAKSPLPIRGEGPVCWTPAGVALHLAAAPGKLVLEDAQTGVPQREFPLPINGAAEPVRALSPDGWLIAAAVGGQVLVWAADSGKLLGRIESSATGLAFSPNGSLLGLGTEDGTARVYALPSLAPLAVLPPPERGSPILCLAFAANRVVRFAEEARSNSWLLATGDQGAGIVIWDLDRRVTRSVCRGSTWIVTALAFSPDGLVLASAGRNQPRLWDVVMGKPLLELSETSSGASLMLAFDATGTRLATGGLAEGGLAKTALWEIEPDRGIRGLRGLAAPVRKVWFSRDSRRVAALSDDWHLGVWEIPSHRLLHIFETPVGSFADSAGGCFDATGQRFAFATWHEACVYDLETGRTRRRWYMGDGSCDQLEFDSANRLILLRRERRSEPPMSVWKVYELGAGVAPALLHEQSQTNWGAFEMVLLPGGKRFLVWNRKAPVCLQAYDVESGREVWRMPTEKTSGDNFRASPDPTGEVFGCTAFTDASSRLRLIRVSDFAEIGVTADSRQAVGPSGKEFAGNGWFFPDRTGVQHGVPMTTDWETGSCAPEFSPDGRLIAWGSAEGVVVVANVAVVRERLTSFLK